MTILKFTTAECEQLLPQVLIDYLWRLVAENDSQEQTFILSAKHTGAGDVQDILLRRGQLSSWRQVFGYQPVDAVVEVRFTDYGAVMALKEPVRAA